MAEPVITPTAPRKKRTGRWVLATILIIAILQTGPSLWIVTSRDLTAGFDWVGYSVYQLGSMVVPLAAGCLGLLFRRKPGLGYFIVAMIVFVLGFVGNALA